MPAGGDIFMGRVYVRIVEMVYTNKYTITLHPNITIATS